MGCQFEKKLDARGEEITLDINALTQGLFVLPQLFPTRISRRNEKHAERVRSEWEDAQKLLDNQQQWKAVPEGMAFSTCTPQGESKV